MKVIKVGDCNDCVYGDKPFYCYERVFHGEPKGCKLQKISKTDGGRFGLAEGVTVYYWIEFNKEREQE